MLVYKVLLELLVDEGYAVKEYDKGEFSVN